MITVLVTRPGGEGDPLVQALRQRGYRVHAVPTVATDAVELAGRSLETFDWIVLTSARGLEAIEKLPSSPKFAVVGPETANALRARGVEPSYIPARADGADLGNSMPDVHGKRIALVRASAAAPDLPDRLRERGATVEEVVAYRTVEGPTASAEQFRTALADPDLAAVVFASGSAVRGFMTLGGSTRLHAITIGPRTSASARNLGFGVITEADTQDVAGLSNAVAHALPLEVPKNA